jgi:hypothetical protein
MSTTLKLGKRGTNVGNVNLPAATAGGATRRASKAASEASAATHAAFEASARGTRVGEARLGLSIFADVYESTHKVLVTERRHGVLSLLPSRIFHDATALYPSKSQSTSILSTIKTSHQLLPLTFRSAEARRRRIGPRQLRGVSMRSRAV